ncbi:MAG: hypothetical protein WCX61_03410 [Candidatus Peribacteraceae bacterium]|jgi:hypothetical protein
MKNEEVNALFIIHFSRPNDPPSLLTALGASVGRDLEAFGFLSASNYYSRPNDRRAGALVSWVFQVGDRIRGPQSEEIEPPLTRVEEKRLL